MDFLPLPSEITPVRSETIFMIGEFPVVNTFLMLLLVTAVIGGLIYLIRRTFSLLPGRFQSAVEMLSEAILNLTEQITGESKQAKIIFPLIASLAIYIGLSNLLGLFPGLGALTYNGTSIFRTPTSDFNTTFGLALSMVFFMQLVSINSWGFGGYLGKFFQFKEVFVGFRQGYQAGLMAIVGFFVGLLDIVGEVAKVISLSLRLFGNMYAGEVLMVILLGSVAYIVPSLWLAMGLLSAIVQATVFAALVAAYYSLSLKPQEEVINQEGNY